MTVSATTQTLEEGPRNLIVQWNGIGDGAGQENKVLKVDVSQLTPACSRVRIDKITGTVDFGVVQLFWDATPAPVKFMDLSGQVDFDFCKEGGLNNKTPGFTGDVLLSTVGFEANSVYALNVEMVKKQ